MGREDLVGLEDSLGVDGAIGGMLGGMEEWGVEEQEVEV